MPSLCRWDIPPRLRHNINPTQLKPGANQVSDDQGVTPPPPPTALTCCPCTWWGQGGSNVGVVCFFCGLG